MVYGIIAAGEGSRLSSEGYKGLKPMVKINGEMMIDRLINIFINNHAEQINIIINESSNELSKYLHSKQTPVPLKIITKTTPSSLHSFNELLLKSGNLNEICLTTADTIFDKEEFTKYIQKFLSDQQNDGLLAVTSFIDDEKPLYIDFDSDFKITQITDQSILLNPFVSGGIYCLRKQALNLVSFAINNGFDRMRNFQRLMTEKNLILKAYSFNKIMDVDHVSDIKKAEKFLRKIEHPFLNE